MLLRPLRIDWRYATGEVAIIVIGILVAITLDNCNDTRIERRVERDYLARLTEDVRADTATFTMDSATVRLQLAALTDRIVGSDLPAAITAERNLAVFVSATNAELRRRSIELLKRLEGRR